MGKTLNYSSITKKIIMSLAGLFLVSFDMPLKLLYAFVGK